MSIAIQRLFMSRPARAAALLLFSMWLTGCGGPDPAEHVARGDAFAAESKWAEASIEYRNALQADPNLGDVREKLGDLYMRQNEPGQALREYVRAADLLPDSLSAQLKAGNLLLVAGQFQDAQGRAKRAIAIDVTSPEAQVLLGNTLAGLRDVEGAIAEYRQALILNPLEEIAYSNIATLQMSSGQLAEAEGTFRKAIEVAPRSIQARLGLANFLWANTRVAEAEQAFKDALGIDPKNAEAARALGTFYVGAGRVPEAEPHFKTLAEAGGTPASSLALADYYILATRYDDARALLKQIAADKDAFAPAMLRLAAIDVAQGVRAEAQDKLRQVLERHPKDMSARLMSARLLVVDGKRDEALAQVVSIAKDDPQSPVVADAQMVAGTLQAALDRPEDAIKSFEDVLRRRPRTTAAELALARLHLSSGAFDRAETYVKDALSTDSKNPAARAEMTRILLAQGRTAEARTQLASLQKEFPNAAPVLHLTGLQQLSAGNAPAARATYTRLVQAQPSDIEAIAALVRIDLATGRRTEALARVNDALKSVAPTAALHVVAAQAFASTGDSVKAEEALRKAIEIEPTRLQAYSMLGLLYARQNRLVEATAHFQEVATRNPSSVSAATMLGMLYEARGNLQDAEREYRRVLALDRESPVAANNLAWIYISSNRNVSEALELARTALRSLPDEPNVNDTLGWIYYRQGQFSMAIQHLEHALTKDPSMAQTHYHLGLAYLGFSERDKARESFKRALSSGAQFAGNADARAKLAELGG